MLLIKRSSLNWFKASPVRGHRKPCYWKLELLLAIVGQLAQESSGEGFGLQKYLTKLHISKPLAFTVFMLIGLK